MRYYARDQRSFAGKMKFSVFNTRPERATFPVLGDTAAARRARGQGADDRRRLPIPATRELEAVGVVASTYEPLEIRFNEFEAPAAGRYKLRLSARTRSGSGRARGRNEVVHSRISTTFRRAPAGAGDDLRRDAAAPAPPARRVRRHAGADGAASSTSGCSRARRSAPTPRGSSARGRRTGRTRSPRRTASPASRSAGWRSRGRSYDEWPRRRSHAALRRPAAEEPRKRAGATGRSRVGAARRRTPSGCCGTSRGAGAYRRPVRPSAR